MTEYDVIIAGYGPTGAVAANLLGARGLDVLVVDPSETIYDIPRAVHFDGEVMRVFQAIGLSDEVEAVAEEGTELSFVNARGETLIYQNMGQIPRRNHWPNDLFFNQPALEKLLRAGVDRYANVDVELGWGLHSFTQSEAGVEAVLSRDEGKDDDRRPVRGRYLIAADGASSPARKHLGIGQEDLECDDPWLVVDWLLEEGTSFQKGAYQICDPSRPATLVPCEGTHIRWEFMLNPEDEIQDLEDEATVRALMAPHVHRLSSDLDHQAGELIRAKVYNFHALIAETFQAGRVFILETPRIRCRPS